MESVNKNSLCRLCLLNSDSLYDIFEINNKHGYLAAEVIEDLLQLEVSEGDAYPNFVCEKCLEKLTEFKQFKNQCHISKATYDNVFSVEDNLSGDEDCRNSRCTIGPTIVKVEPVTKMDNEDEQSQMCQTLSKEDSVSKTGNEDEQPQTGPTIVKVEPVTKICNEDKQSQMNIRSMNLDGEVIIPDELSDNDRCSPKPLELVKVTKANGSQSQASVPTDQSARIRINSKVTDDYENHFQCKLCGKSFPQRSKLTRHIRTHSGEKPFSCEVCGRAFGQKGNLDQHKRTHSGEKPYTCEVCNKSFSQNGSLKSHLRIHSGEKPYRCSLCGKGFTNKARLDYHLRSHYGEKPYSCDKCDKKFAGKQNLAMHMMKIHIKE